MYAAEVMTLASQWRTEDLHKLLENKILREPESSQRPAFMSELLTLQRFRLRQYLGRTVVHCPMGRLSLSPV